MLPAHPLIDVSVTIRPRMPIYPGDPGVDIALSHAIARGDPANVSRLQFGAHTGTHVDAPRHFIEDGPGADELALESLVGPCVVADATGATSRIDAQLVDSLGLDEGSERVLLKTPTRGCGSATRSPRTSSRWTAAAPTHSSAAACAWSASTTCPSATRRSTTRSSASASA